MTTPFAYTGRILRVDLSSCTFSTISTMDYARRFLGGRGIAAAIYWDEVDPAVKAFDPENRLIFITGPMAGISPGVAGIRWLVCGKSPATRPEQFSYANLGGSWGTELKRAGYDGLIVQGASETPVYLKIENGKAAFEDARRLWGKSTIDAIAMLKKELGNGSRVVATGPAGENRVTMATLLADNDASASGGFGAVMGAKGLKAIAVSGDRDIVGASPDQLLALNRQLRQMKKTSSAASVWGNAVTPEKKHQDMCRGCSLGCGRFVYEDRTGRQGKFICGQVGFYQGRAARFYGENDWQDVPFQAAMLANDYGVDVFALGTLMMWLSRCHKTGILTDEATGIPFSRMGSLEFMETLLKKMAAREGVGDLLADGLFQAAEKLGPDAQQLITDYVAKDETGLAYDPRYYITTGLLYAMEPRMPIQQLHEVSRPLLAWVQWANQVEGAYVSTEVLRAVARRFWGTDLAVDLSTYDGKAAVAARIQDRRYVHESMILCDWAWPVFTVEFSEDHLGDPALESNVLSAATGIDISEEELYTTGERIVNLQRAIMVREARGSDTLPEAYFITPMRFDPTNPNGVAPGKNGEIIDKKGAVLDKSEFEQTQKEFYELRGWDRDSGLQTRKKLASLDLGGVADALAEQGLAV